MFPVRRRPLALALVLLMVPLAGCVDAIGALAGRDRGECAAEDVPSGTSSRDGATETVANSSGRRGGNPAVTRTHTIEAPTDAEGLAAVLDTVNGDVRVQPGAEGRWRLVATLTGWGPTEAEARDSLRCLRLAWSAGEDRDGAAFLRAEVEYPGSGGPRQGREGDLRLEVPASLLLELDAGTVNGKVAAERVRASTLRLDAVNGEVHAEASDVRDANLENVNGKILALLQPGGSGRVAVSNVNGDVDVRVTEGARFGYDVRVSSVNGDSTIGLRDGQGSADDGPGPSSASFRSTGYEGREVRTVLRVDTVNGDATVDGM